MKIPDHRHRLAPEVFRQRLLIEGIYTIKAGEAEVRSFLLGLAAHLGMRTYGEPMVYSTGGQGQEINQGYDAFVPLVDSGISAYVWSGPRLLSLIIYTCKGFDPQAAIVYSKDFWAITGEMVCQEF